MFHGKTYKLGKYLKISKMLLLPEKMQRSNTSEIFHSRKITVLDYQICQIYAEGWAEFNDSGIDVEYLLKNE